MFNLCKILGVEEGEVFKLNGADYKIENNKFKHKSSDTGEFVAVSYSLNLLAEAEFVRLPFVPNYKQEYWSPAILNPGETISVWTTNEYTRQDLYAIKLNIAFRTKEDCDKLGVPLMEQWKKELGW